MLDYERRRARSGKLRALVYDSLLSTTAVFSYATRGPENCQLNEHFVFVFCAQTVVRLLQTTQIM